MTIRRLLFAATLLVTVMLLQVVVVNRLGLPGAPPELVLLTVLSLALVYGPAGGAVTGFLAGLAIDIIPPSDHLIGQAALVFCLAGYVAGLAKWDIDRSAFMPLVVVVSTAVSASVLYAAFAAVVADPRVTWHTLTLNVSTSALYDLLVAPFLVPLVLSMARRFEPDAARI